MYMHTHTHFTDRPTRNTDPSGGRYDETPCLAPRRLLAELDAKQSDLLRARVLEMVAASYTGEAGGSVAVPVSAYFGVAVKA